MASRRPVPQVAVRYRNGVASHAVLWTILQKHKTRFIISYTARNPSSQCFLNSCLKTLSLALLAPGQGSQTPGMLAAWLGAAGRCRASGHLVGDQRPGPGPPRHHRDRRGDHRHRGDSAAGGRPRRCWPTRNSTARLARRAIRHGRGRPFGRRDRRVRHRRCHLRRRRRQAGRHPRRRDGQGLRAWSRPAWPRCSAATRPRCSARLDALDLVPANRNAAGQIVAAGALVRAGQAGRGSCRPRPGSASWPPLARSTPTTWLRPPDGYAGAAETVSHHRAHRELCCPTPTANPSPQPRTP